MDAVALGRLVADFLVVLAAGLAAGVACKRLGVSLLVGYLVIGAVIGRGGLGLVAQGGHELEWMAQAGALLLLFSVGIEFSLEELVRLGRRFVVGGAAQMLLVAAPLVPLAVGFGLGWRAAVLAAFAASLSSTVLVFKALAEWGQASSPPGRLAIGILLFQDVALVPLMLLVPLLTGQGEPPGLGDYAALAAKAVAAVAAVAGLRAAVAAWVVPLLARLRSLELVVLFAVCVLGGCCWASHRLGLPTALGALGAGLMLSGNRLSQQVDTILLPYRETFAAVFFVALGMLLEPGAVLREPVLLGAGLAGMVALKAGAAALALRLVGLPWRPSVGMGLGLAQLGEFSFLLVAEGARQGVITPRDYSRMLAIALGTLVLTPLLLRYGLRWTRGVGVGQEEPERAGPRAVPHAVVVGIGPIGRQVASQLETAGVAVCLVDLSPVNLYPFAQMGFATVAGDAREPEVLRRAEADRCKLGVVCVPDDAAAIQVVRGLREVAPEAYLVVRCRYLANVPAVTKAGASAVVSEEGQASVRLLQLCEQITRPPG